MKKFIVFINLKSGIEKASLAEYSENETHRFNELISEKIIQTYYKKKDLLKFWCIVSCVSKSDAEESLFSLPFYQKGFITIDIEELEG